MPLKLTFLITAILVSAFSSFSQQFSSSNLPIVIINPESDILDESRVSADMKIIYRGPGLRNSMTDVNDTSALDYNGRITIETRGSSSQTTYKKQYALTTMKPDDINKDKVKLLGLPKENDWILNGMVFDPALIRDYLCYNLSRMIGEYASRTVYCEVVIGGVYKGLYLLQEKIKADDNRVDVVKIEQTDNLLPGLSGGYITKADKTTGGDPVAWTMYSRSNESVNYIHVLPKPEEVTPVQNTYINNQFYNLESATASNNSSVINGYPSIIDIPSFIHYILISELSSNCDAYMFSTYFHKDRNGKLRAGPIWDGDLTFGNDLFFWGLDRSWYNVWQLSNNDNEGSKFWVQLFNNSTFRCYLTKRWHQLTKQGQPLNGQSIKNLIDQTVSVISEAVQRERATYGYSRDYATEIQNMKNFIDKRITWMNNNLGTYGQCSSPSEPDLVISKIMYHPDTTAEFTSSDDQEFIEIMNTGNTTVDLSGDYFRGTGFVYQFPASSVIDRNQAIVLASKASVFKSRYGGAPFGEFTRHLSNKGQAIIFSDAFGNTIDSVFYSDDLPWPDADGNGYYLNLISTDLDNSLASSWTTSNDFVVSNQKPDVPPQTFTIFPNPVRTVLTILSQENIISVRILDLSGRIMVTDRVGANDFQIDFTSFQPGTYIVQMFNETGVFTEKVIKE
ncbi:MAG TPA: CotH kinase family protein [Bacteroidales bacterium]|nr:CotH kinase family protein [Bacteroidales bacterium]